MKQSTSRNHGSQYDEAFFQTLSQGAARSAAVLVPLIMTVLKPRSVVDVGCGVGSWLAVFHRHGVEDYLGFDGSWVARDKLEIPPDRFIATDLEGPLPAVRRFDLVISLEVAEHLPAACAESFVHSLTTLGDRVVFSAAIPHQGGTDHRNEEWPSYWAALFDKRGYESLDVIRPFLWQAPDVETCYCQNTVLFVRRGTPLPDVTGWPMRGAPDLVHPRKYLQVQRMLERVTALQDPRHMPLRQLLNALPIVFWSALRRRIG